MSDETHEFSLDYDATTVRCAVCGLNESHPLHVKAMTGERIDVKALVERARDAVADPNTLDYDGLGGDDDPAIPLIARLADALEAVTRERDAMRSVYERVRETYGDQPQSVRKLIDAARGSTHAEE